MPAIKVSELKRMHEANGGDWTVRHLSEALREKHLRPEDFSVRELAEGLVPDGRAWVESMNPRGGVQILREDAVNTTAFSNVMGQIVYNKLLDSYMMPEFVLSRTIPATKTPFKREKIAGTQRLGDKFTSAVAEGHDYPEFGLGEDYIETTETQKLGGIVPVTKETIYFDRTGQILGHAAQVGEYMGLRKEKLLSDCLLGNTPWYWTGTTYSDIYNTGLFTNSQANALVQWTDVDESRALFLAIKDPYTNEPIMVGGRDILVSPYAEYNARRILNATEVRLGDGASATYQTASANPLPGGYNLMSSLYMHDRLVADGVSAANAKAYWFHGDFAKAIAWMENWPLTVTQAPMNNDREFRADIVHQFKVSLMGSASVLDPRYVVRNTN